MRLRSLLLTLPLLAIAVSGCDRPADPADTDPRAQQPLPATGDGAGDALTDGDATTTPVQPAVAQAMARVILRPTAGNAVSGELVLSQTAGGVRIAGEVRGLNPNAEHGFHVHEHGDCSADDASSAGAHFAPDGHPHGAPGSEAHHAGDMPNLVADEHGVALVDLLLDRVELGTDGRHDIGGRAILVHAQADDFTTQPAGDSGARIACGVIHTQR